jgi:hypothetical protein
MRRAWDRTTTDPWQRDQRRHPLRGSVGSREINGVEMEQWQYEVTGGGRVWYYIDDGHRTIWLTNCSVGHPKATD